MRGKRIEFTAALGERICALLAEGQTVREVCEAPGMPTAVTLLRWARKRSDFRPLYLAAMGPRAVGSHGHRPRGQTVANNGRPTIYTTEMAQAVCARIAAGASMLDLKDCRDVPSTTALYDWLAEYDEFRRLYQTACEHRAETLAEEALKIADDRTGDLRPGKDGVLIPNPANVQRARLMVETRKWRVSRLTPRKYGLGCEPDDGMTHEDWVDLLD